jgi:hypothetical protein
LKTKNSRLQKHVNHGNHVLLIVQIPKPFFPASVLFISLASLFQQQWLIMVA